jgi:hypothetical protein
MKIENGQFKNIVLEEFDAMIKETSLNEGWLDRMKKALGSGAVASMADWEGAAADLDDDAVADDDEATAIRQKALDNAVDTAKDAVQAFADAVSKKRSAMTKRLSKIDLDDLLELNPELVKSVRGALSSSKSLQTRLNNLILNLDLVKGEGNIETAADLEALESPGASPEDLQKWRNKAGNTASSKRRTAAYSDKMARARGIKEEETTLTKESLIKMIRDELKN